MKKVAKILITTGMGIMMLIVFFVIVVSLINGITDKPTIYDHIAMNFLVANLGILAVGVILLMIVNRKEIITDIKNFINK